MNPKDDRFARPLRALALLSIVWVMVPASAQESALEKITEVEGITEYRMANGLKVLLFPDPTASTVTVNITYRVGSRHEGRGEKGMAHLLEHMLFKGTPTFENSMGALQDHGANFNGTTSFDRTNYFETLSSSEENLEFALRFEADRMVNSLISAEDLATEMTVVRNEFEMGENSPDRVLQERILSTAFLWHNYGLSPIGNRSDLERVPAESLQRFYRKYYQPDNAMLVVAGKFEADWTLQKIQQYFGVVPRPERRLEESYTEEPTQDGARSVVLRRVGSVAAAGLVYHVPSGADPQIVALDVLAGVLAQPPSGRLYKAIVESGRAARTSAFTYSLREPGVFLVSASVPTDQDVESTLEVMIEVVEGVGGTVTEEEVERAKAEQLKRIKLALTDSRRIGLTLSESEAVGDWRLLFLQRDQLRDVSVDDVNRVAKQYLLESNRTAGVYIPTQEPRRAEIPPKPDVEALLRDYRGSESIELGEEFLATAENIDRSTIRKRVGDIDLAMLPKSTRGRVVVGNFVLRYGDADSLLGHDTALGLLPALMMRGAGEFDYQGLRDELNRIETELQVSGGPGSIRASLKTTRENLSAALDLLGVILKEPLLPAEELEVIRNERLANLDRMKSDPQGIVFSEISRSLSPYPKGDVRYRPSFDERAEGLKAVDIEEIRELYASQIGAGELDASFVGDFDPEEIAAKIGETFGDWRSELQYERIAAENLPIQPEKRTIDTPDKQMALVAWGTTFALRDDDPAYPALRFANFVLGQHPASRLMTALRHEGGLSYDAGSMLSVDDEDEVARLLAYAMCAPQNAKEVQDVLRSEIERFLAEGLAEEEIDAARKGYLEAFKNQMANDGYVVRQLLSDLRTGRNLRFHESVVQAIEDLGSEELLAALSVIDGSSSIEIVGGDVAKFGGDP